ncbi:hypothetical protein FHX44_112349 [Pseudonocardia hierapolitana]|uniref:Uncharacterized protein n=1 Tax=Pseudonocardia hierapolitana TaxID=1128676 RepID=A0A561SNM4_9PSEU|nr:hypothetical protein [Pseudonocardia hierapolitana]TWF76459.1 hypothetical protein FHX44_112349 [Pseudonocardia hierapolitana]
MTLTSVWVQTHSDGLVRADQVIGIEAHSTAGLRDTPSHWLLDVVLATSVGSGYRESWTVTALHRTLAQTAFPPEGSSMALAGLLARLDTISAMGIITVEKEDPAVPDTDAFTASASGIRFRFMPFPPPAPQDRTDAEYL